MKKSASAMIALALAVPAMVAPAFAAPDHNDHKHYDRGHDERSHYNRPPNRGNPFRKGQRFDRMRAPNYRVIDYRHYRRLSPPPRGYHWVRSGNDALLVAITSGVIASVIANTF